MSAIRTIVSKDNPRLKQLRTALLKPSARRDGLIALEGFHLVEEALASGVSIHTIFFAQGCEALLETLRLPTSIEILALPAPLLAASVTTESPQPIAALIAPPAWQWSLLLGVPAPLLVVLAGVQDPGNLGTILRSAEAFGASGAILLPGTVSPWNPKALRASAGSVFRLPTIAASAEKCFRQLAEAGIPAIAAMPREVATERRCEALTPPLAIVIGSEGAGVPPEIAARCDHAVTIPCPGPVESLNAAVAASILLYEAARQRGKTLP